MTEKRTLLLIDVSGIFYATWHASGDLDVGEAFRRTLAKVAQLRAGYDLVAVAVDSPPYDRKAIFPEYKSNREKAPAALVEQLRRVIERLEADGLLCWSHPGVEADDVIATAAVRARDDGLDVVIASSDKDLLQLVSPSCRVLSPATGEMYGPVEVGAKFGVGPNQIRDLLTLMGDASDNVPGIDGVGAKTAAKLLANFGDLDGVLRAANESDPLITPKVCAAIIAGADLVGVAKKLVTLRTDIPLNFAEVYEVREPTSLADAIDLDEEPEAGRRLVGAAAEKPETALTRVITPQVIEWSMMLEPSDSSRAWKLAQLLYNSRLYQRFGSSEAILAVMLRGRALGLDATLSLDAFHVIEGKPCMHADLIEALVHRSGKAEYFELVETTNESATYRTKRKGQNTEKVLSFGVEEAVRAGMMESDGKGGFRGTAKAPNYTKRPRTMFRHRAKTELARAVYPDVTMGLLAPEEISGEEYAETEE